MGGDDSFVVMKTWKEPSHVGAAFGGLLSRLVISITLPSSWWQIQEQTAAGCRVGHFFSQYPRQDA